IALVGQDNAGEQLQAWPAGLEPHAGVELVGDVGAASGVLVVDELAGLGVESQVFGALAVVGPLIGDRMDELVVQRVGAALDPSRGGRCETVAMTVLGGAAAQTERENRCANRHPHAVSRAAPSHGRVLSPRSPTRVPCWRAGLGKTGRGFYHNGG